MISGGDLYNVLSAVTPLYVAMFLAYGSVKWWKIFTPEQCAGINRFVAVFAVPLLSFEFIYKMNPYTMNMRFLAADVISKAMVLFILGLWAKYAKRGSLEWVITIFSLSTLPNTLVMGIPLLKAMYGDFTEVLMVQTVVFQSILWYAILLFLYEYRSAKMLISGKLQVNSHHVEIQLNGVSPDWKHSSTQIDDQIDAEIGMKTSAEHNNSMRCCSRALRNPMMEMEHNGNCNDGNSLPSTNTCIHKDSSFNIEEFLRNSPSTCSSDPENLHSNSFAPIASNEGLNGDAYSARQAKTPHSNRNCNGGSANAHEHQHLRCHSEAGMSPPPLQLTKRVPVDPSKGDEDANELHMFVWSSSGSNVSDGNCCLRNGSESENETGGSSMRDFDQRKEEQLNSPVSSKRHGTISHVQQASNETRVVNDENVSRLANATSIPQTISDKNNPMFDNGPASVKLTSILNMVWRKLVYNPNTYASILGLIWAFTSYRWHFHMPKIIEGSVSILSNAGLGMAMFSLGLFMALQHKIIACGNLLASVAMILRFIVGPVVMATASVAIGLRHSILHVAIVQAALPQGIVPFVFAREYDLHADILSTAVIFGMIVSLPITILYYVLLGL